MKIIYLTTLIALSTASLCRASDLTCSESMSRSLLDTKAIQLLFNLHNPKTFLIAITGRATSVDKLETVLNAVIDRPDLFEGSPWNASKRVLAAKSMLKRLHVFQDFLKIMPQGSNRVEEISKLSSVLFQDWNPILSTFDPDRMLELAKIEYEVNAHEAKQLKQSTAWNDHLDDEDEDAGSMEIWNDPRLDFDLDRPAGVLTFATGTAIQIASLHETIRRLLNAKLPNKPAEVSDDKWIYLTSKESTEIVANIKKATKLLAHITNYARRKDLYKDGSLEQTFIKNTSSLLEWYADYLEQSVRRMPVVWFWWIPSIPEWVFAELRKINS